MHKSVVVVLVTKRCALVMGVPIRIVAEIQIEWKDVTILEGIPEYNKG